MTTTSKQIQKNTNKWDENTKKNNLKNKKDRIWTQQIWESCGIQSIDERVERRRRECDEHVTRMDAER